MRKKQILYFLLLSIFCSSCEMFNISDVSEQKETNITNNQTDSPERPTNNKGADLPARKNFTEKDLLYQGRAVKLTRHGKCRMDCRKIDAFEIQEVITKGKINHRKSNQNSKPCPTTAYEGKTSDGQMVRVVLGTCENDYKIVTVIDLGNDWKCSCD
jgi:hypothetical protein